MEGDAPIPLPELWTSPLPTAPLDNPLAPPAWVRYTDQTEMPLLPNGQLLTRWAHDIRCCCPNQIAPTIGPTSVHDPTQQACRCRRAEHPSPAATIHSEDSSFGIDALCISPASDASARLISDGSTCSGYPCDTPNIVGQQTPPTRYTLLMGPLDLHHLPCGAPHIPTDAEKDRARARIAEREVQINALEVKIRNLKATFEAESQEKYAAIKDHFNCRILVIQNEITDRLNDALGRTPGSGGGCHGREGEEVALPCPEVRTSGTRSSS